MRSGHAYIRVILLAFFLGSLIGCRQTAQYRAANLPDDVVAPLTRSAKDVNFARIAQSTTGSDAIIVGDVLDVSIVTGLEDKEPTVYQLRVGNDGQIWVPIIGPIRVVGLRLNDAEALVRQEAIRRDIYRSPNVSVAFQDRQSNTVTVTGAVKEPGVKRLPIAKSTLLDAIVAAGELTEDATTIVELQYPATSQVNLQPGADGITQAGYQQGIRPGKRVRIDLNKLEANGRTQVSVQDGVVINVIRRNAQHINVIGLVNNPGQYKMTDGDLTLLEAIALGGGRTLQVANKVKVIRQMRGQDEPIVISASVQQAKRNPDANIRLAPGDIVSVEETPMTFTVDTIRNVIGLGFSSPIPGL